MPERPGWGPQYADLPVRGRGTGAAFEERQTGHSAALEERGSIRGGFMESVGRSARDVLF